MQLRHLLKTGIPLQEALIYVFITCKPEMMEVRTLDSRAEMRTPSCENTERLKLLWLSAMVTSPAALIPTPIG